MNQQIIGNKINAEFKSEIIEYFRASYLGCLLSYTRKFHSYNPQYVHAVLDILREQGYPVDDDIHPQGNIGVLINDDIDNPFSVRLLFFFIYQNKDVKLYKTNLLITPPYVSIFCFPKSTSDFDSLLQEFLESKEDSEIYKMYLNIPLLVEEQFLLTTNNNNVSNS